MKFTFNIEKKHLIFLVVILGIAGLGFVIATAIDTTQPNHGAAQVDLGGGFILGDFASAIKTLPTTPAIICTTANTGDSDCIDASGSGIDTRCDQPGNCVNVYATTGANLGSGTTTVTNLLLNGQVLNDLGVQGSLHVGASDANQGDINFYDEIKPDGNPCLVGQILKKTAANNWDCAADNTVSGDLYATFPKHSTPPFTCDSTNLARAYFDTSHAVDVSTICVCQKEGTNSYVWRALVSFGQPVCT